MICKKCFQAQALVYDEEQTPICLDCWISVPDPELELALWVGSIEKIEKNFDNFFITTDWTV